MDYEKFVFIYFCELLRLYNTTWYKIYVFKIYVQTKKSIKSPQKETYTE